MTHLQLRQWSRLQATSGWQIESTEAAFGRAMTCFCCRPSRAVRRQTQSGRFRLNAVVLPAGCSEDGWHNKRRYPHKSRSLDMPFQSIWEPRGVITVWTGCATGDELLTYISTGQRNPLFDNVHYSLHDFTACTNTEFSFASIEELAAMDSAGARTNPHIKIAVVTDRSDVIAMVGNYIGTELSPYPVRIFPTLKAAREWLVSSETL